jgi:hypothetical protein
MSGDEVAVTLFSGIIGVAVWAWWYGSIFLRKASPVSRTAPPQFLLVAPPLIALLLLFVILRTCAADDVRHDHRYLAMYSVMGMAWVGLGVFVPAALGISFRHDALGRANQPAAWVYGGWILALALAFAGGNIGNGPGWWVVIFSALLATGALIAIAFAWELLTAVHDAVTIDRDVATGLRTGGLLVACGAILGISVAGDWHSVQATTRDFVAAAWSVIPLVLVALVFERLYRPAPSRPRAPVLTGGLVPLLVLWMLAGLWVVFEGGRVLGAGL